MNRVVFCIFVKLSTIHPLISTLTIALDVLVNSAGILVSGATESLELDEFDRCWNINTRAGKVQKLVKLIFSKKYTNIRYHSKFFDCLAHPNLSATLATDQK